MAFSFNLITDLLEIFQYQFMQHAIEAGTVVAIVAGIVGYFVVLRRSSFAAHALSHIGFAGAAGAVLLLIPFMVCCCLRGSVARRWLFSALERHIVMFTSAQFLRLCWA